jgi:acetyl-CoA synthetase
MGLTEFPDPSSWKEVRDRFRWNIPEYFNIASACCDRHASDPTRLALIYENDSGAVESWTFRQIQQAANRLSNALNELGVRAGDRVGIVLPQRPETAIAHIALYKLGAIALPLANLFGPEALKYRLSDSGAIAVIADAENRPKLDEISGDLPDLRIRIQVDPGAHPGEESWTELLSRASDEFMTRSTFAEDPCWIIYTSGTTGNPKGALHAHRVLVGHMTGWEMSHDFAPKPADRTWTPADWAWIGGLANILLCSWYHGLPVLAYRFRKFDPEQAADLMARHSIRNTFLPPTALKFMRQVPGLRERYGFDLRSVMSAGEPLGAEMLAWGEEALGVKINEMYGQTEVNYFVGNCQRLEPARPGSMGRAYPGHTAAVLDGEGNILPPGSRGEIAFHRPGDPVFFLRYWNNEEGTRNKFSGDWARSGDEGTMDEAGFLWFHGRTDDVITSAGYRIGPAEIEEQLLKHPAVAVAAAVGVPDELRGHVVKAFLKLKPEFQPSEALKEEVQAFVRDRLAAHEYPRQVEFIEDLPLTTTGKVMRRILRNPPA